MTITGQGMFPSQRHGVPCDSAASPSLSHTETLQVYNGTRRRSVKLTASIPDGVSHLNSSFRCKKLKLHAEQLSECRCES